MSIIIVIYVTVLENETFRANGTVDSAKHVNGVQVSGGLLFGEKHESLQSCSVWAGSGILTEYCSSLIRIRMVPLKSG